MVARVSFQVADPVHKIKTVAIKDMARQALGWPPPRLSTRRRVRRLLAEASAAGEALVPGDGHAFHP
ncbi:MAG: hypothetical protein E5V92_24755 [Mesorhizobium sp.]|nr:MAG: hypothetical protein E5V92_24755 [Mesorhizobium sp.]